MLSCVLLTREAGRRLPLRASAISSVDSVAIGGAVSLLRPLLTVVARTIQSGRYHLLFIAHRRLPFRPHQRATSLVCTHLHKVCRALVCCTLKAAQGVLRGEMG